MTLICNHPETPVRTQLEVYRFRGEEEGGPSDEDGATHFAVVAGGPMPLPTTGGTLSNRR